MKRAQNCISDINAAFDFQTADGKITHLTALFGGSGVGHKDPSSSLGARLFPARASSLEVWAVGLKPSDLSASAIKEATAIAVAAISTPF